MTVSGPGCTAKHETPQLGSPSPIRRGEPHEDRFRSIARPGPGGGKNLASTDAQGGGTGQECDRSDPAVPPAPSTRIDQRGSAPELLVLRGSGAGNLSVSLFGRENRARVPSQRVRLVRAEAVAGHGSKDHAPKKAMMPMKVGGQARAGYGRNVLREKTPGGSARGQGRRQDL